MYVDNKEFKYIGNNINKFKCFALKIIFTW